MQMKPSKKRRPSTIVLFGTLYKFNGGRWLATVRWPPIIVKLIDRGRCVLRNVRDAHTLASTTANTRFEYQLNGSCFIRTFQNVVWCVIFQHLRIFRFLFSTYRFISHLYLFVFLWDCFQLMLTFHWFYYHGLTTPANAIFLSFNFFLRSLLKITRVKQPTVLPK